MKRCAGRLAATTLALAGTAALAQVRVLTPEELYDRLAPSVWLVETQEKAGKGGSIGSAVVIAPGELITNCHVLENAETIIVSHAERDRRGMPARLEYRDPSRDLCQLRAEGVLAPAVQRAPADTLRPGAKVYAIGNPRGLELTISDGLVSGLRRDGAGALQRVQISVPISPGSSGGGLFDAYGRLVGITTSGVRDAQNLNFALPADWIAELKARARAEPPTQVARPAAPMPRAAAPVPRAPEPAPDIPVTGLGPVPGRVFEYRLRDRLSRQERLVTLHVDAIAGDRVSFNQGARVEDAAGRLLTTQAPLLGEVDAAMPPGGWIRPGTATGASWHIENTNRSSQGELTLDVNARATALVQLVVAGQPVQALRVEYSGYSRRGVSLARPPTGRYDATGWYVDGRPVRFEVRTRGGTGGDAFFVDELLELVRVH